MKLKQSPVDRVRFSGHEFFIKRDDLLHPDFSGNKARKFYSFLRQDFAGFDTLIGHGSPQANSLYSLSVLAKMKGLKLDFYVDHIADFLKLNPKGNYRAALSYGANIIETRELAEGLAAEQYLKQVVLPNEQRSWFVPEGGRCGYAEEGVKLLAEEILIWAHTKQIEDLKVFLPSGTGTTSLFLQKHLPFDVFTCPCVGDSAYLKQQFSMLSGGDAAFPTILSPRKKFHFGKLYPEFYQVWLDLKEQIGVEFELLYDPAGWLTLLDHLESEPMELPWLYVHQGGLLGNETMQPRYVRKYGLARR